jgi:uncharacterized membrane protein (DUF4010 family)
MEEYYLIQTEAFQLTQIDFFIRMLVATGIGCIIGLEREYTSMSNNQTVFAGVRTFAMVGLFGFLSAFLSFYFTHWVVVGGLLGTIMVVLVSYWISARKGEIGVTTEFTTLLTFLLGCLTLLGFVEASLAITVIVLVLLSLKAPLKNIIGRITNKEMYAFVKFVVLALLIFPFLPNQTFGYYDVFNPRELGLVILLTSGLGFLGYLLMKFLGGNRGVLLTGIVGGLVSSTVVTWIFSRKSKEAPELARICTVAIIAASTIMVVRVVVWVMIFNKALLSGLLVPMLLLFITSLGIALYYYREQESLPQVKTDFPLGEPLELREAILFGLLYTGILLLVSYANDRFGEEGIFLSSAIASLTDIDAITISMSKLAGDKIGLLTAQNAILLATLSNTIVKIGIALWIGSNSLRKYILISYGLVFLAGLVGFLVLNYWGA